MSSTSQQLSQITDGGSLFPYLLPFKVPLLFSPLDFYLTSQWALLPFLCLEGLVYAKLFAKLGYCRTLYPFP
jgi:hypothetical protein